MGTLGRFGKSQCERYPEGMSSEHILEFWEQQAIDHGQEHSASWGDSGMIRLEVAEIARRLPPTGKVLDAGCANGYSTELIQVQAPGLSMTGLDFAPAMIREAVGREKQSGSGVQYQVGDIRRLPFEDASFDAAFTTRTIINLPTWVDQIEAFREMIRVVRPGGKLLISEAFWEPLCKLNSVRQVAGLDPLEEHDFNRYLKEYRVRGLLSDLGLEFSIVPFSSVYYLGTRFLRELVTDSSAYPGYSNPINEVSFELEQNWSGGPFSVQSLIEITI